jgi:hypothetical protein
MKEGLIVYLVSNAAPGVEFEAGAVSRTPEFRADRVELVSREAGFFTVEDAWHFLYTRGCGRISLQVAEAGDAGALQPLGPRVRLCG